MTVGEKLLDLRKKKSLSQEEVANILNVSRQTISKWETDQSTPDFDKIMPICNLYNISADELMSGEIRKEEQYEKTSTYDKNKKAKIIGISTCLYILSVVWIIFATVTLNSPILGVCLFLTIIAVATGLIVYNSISNSKDKKELTKEEKTIKQINEVISIFILIIYFIVSFTTMAWHITWILFLISGLLEEIVKLIFSLKEDKSEK